MTMPSAMPAALPRPPIEVPQIGGRTVELVRLDPPQHAAGLWASIGAHPELWTGTPAGPFADEAAFSLWLHERTQRAGSQLYTLVDLRGASATPAGLYFLLQITPQMGTVELGLVYGQALRQQRGGTEAFYLIAQHLFDELRYRRLEWRCDVDHRASRRAAERFGFVLEGVLRQSMWVKGKSWDTAVYSILDGEWPTHRERLRAWLADENFSDDGKQKRALAGC